jgi:hypothetical protein
VVVWFADAPEPKAVRAAAFFDRDRALAEAGKPTG